MPDGNSDVVIVRIGKPVSALSDNEWVCPYEIRAFGESRMFSFRGVDSAQALLLTMQAILPELNALAKRVGGSCSWLEDDNAGFPDYRAAPKHGGKK